MAPWLDSQARRLRGVWGVWEEEATRAELVIERLVSGDVSGSGAAEHRRNWKRKRRVSGRETPADDGLRGFGKSRRS